MERTKSMNAPSSTNNAEANTSAMPSTPTRSSWVQTASGQNSRDVRAAAAE